MDKFTQTSRSLIVLATLLLTIALSPQQIAHALTFTVINTNDSAAGSLRQAILDANLAAGADTIDFDATVFSTTQTINLTSGQLLVTSAITFVGPAANVIVNQTVSGQRVIQMNAGPVTMTNMTIQGGSINANGSGILINNNGGAATNYTFDAGMIIQNNINTGTSAFGGGIAAFNNAQVTLQGGMQLINNGARSGGGIFLNFEADLFVNGATISGNTATVQGGGIRISGTGDLPGDTSNQAFATITSATISGNTASSAGGGIYAFGPSTISVSDSTLSNNTASSAFSGFFGGLAAEGSLATSGGQTTGAPTVTISASTVSGNTGNLGGGAGGATVGGNIILNNTTVSGNLTTTATLFATPLGNGGGFSITNIGTNDGTWSVPSALTVNDSTISTNTSVRDGGGIFINGGTLTVTGSRIINNTATNNGDAVYSVNAGTVSSTCIVGNSDTAVFNTTGTLSALGNWWGTTWGPNIPAAPISSGSLVSVGDSISGTGDSTSSVDVGITSYGDYSTAPTGNWLLTAPASCAVCVDGMNPSSIGHTRVCS